MNLYQELKQRIASRKARVGVIGLGYVGLPLILSMARAGFSTVGIDVDSKKVKLLKAGKSYIGDISDAEAAELIKKHAFKPTSDYSVVATLDCLIICVPTPLGKSKEPDLSFILSAVKAMAKHCRKGQLVILESTTYPGTTEESIAPLIEEVSGLKAGRDIYLGFSPERVDPANQTWNIQDIPKVIGGLNAMSRKLISELYGSVFHRVVPVSSPRTAEMVKLLENTFRSVNIGLINEMAMVCDTLKVDIWEVIEAAKTKPFGFMPFYPGPGIGGHCIQIDSMYLAWKVRLHGYEPRLIELAQAINDGMPQIVIERVVRILNEWKQALNGSKILILGVTYKKNVSDMRESPALAIIQGLLGRGAKVKYHDPFAPEIKGLGGELKSHALTKKLIDSHDMVLILTDHDDVNYDMLLQTKTKILDTRNALRNGKRRKTVYKL